MPSAKDKRKAIAKKADLKVQKAQGVRKRKLAKKAGVDATTGAARTVKGSKNVSMGKIREQARKDVKAMKKKKK